MLELKVFNSNGVSPLSEQLPDFSGSFGQIFAFSFLGSDFVLKSLKFSPGEKPRSSVLRKSIREYCVSKICSALRCSPKTLTPFGFDLLVYSDCVEFAIEKC